MGGVFIVLIIVLAASIIALAIYQAHKRREMWRNLAAHYGLQYDKGDPLDLLNRYEFGLFQSGHSQSVYNTLYGDVDGHNVAIFDFYYVTGSGKHRQSHYYSALLMDLPCSGSLHIRPEGFFDRIAAAFGFDDYNFEYEAFNRSFRVTGPDKKFAYDICHGPMMEYLLQHPEHCWEIQKDKLLLYSSSMSTFDADEVERSLRDARGFIERLPSYLVEK